MKRIKIIIYSILFISIANGCGDQLDQTNPNVLTVDTFWKTEADFLQGLAATYKTFTYPFGSGYWNVRGIELTNGRGDDFYIRNDIANLYKMSTFSSDPNNGDVANLFSTLYTGIFRANQVIENALKTSIAADKKAQYIAEAKFLRGLNYFLLAINFGSVPIRATVPKTREDYFISKSPESEVWKQVYEDLKEAKASLPDSHPAQFVGRATRGAAIGFLGKAYVYNQLWTEAEAEFALLSQPGGQAQPPFAYDLMPNFEDNFNAAFDNNKEGLFEIQFDNVGGTNFWENSGATQGQGTVTAQENAPGEVQGWFEAFPTNKLFNEFQLEKTTEADFDPRMYATLVWDYPGAMYYQKPFANFKAPAPQYSSRWRKYQNWRAASESDATAGLVFGVSSINEKALRYADILLLYAEALTMNNKVVQAYPLINRIRSRAKLANLVAGKSQTEMMAEIRHQRMIEFAREGQRFYDLKRWGILQQEILNSDKDGKDNFNLSTHQYYPIPQAEINSNPKIDG